jgi:starvation-inducible DNA-binding protein
MKPTIGLSDASRKAVASMLNSVLSDEMVLLVKTRGFHWNVTGPHFSELHDLFQAQYEALAVSVDDVAERARALGAFSHGSMGAFLKNATLKEAAAVPPKAGAMLKALLADHEALVRTLRKAVDDCQDRYGDAGTADFLTGLMEAHEKTAWMLRSYLEP